MHVQSLPKSCVGPFRVALLLAFLSVSTVPAAGQVVSTNVPDNLGTFGVGEIQWPLVASDGSGPCAGTWAVTSGALPPGVSLKTDVPSWAPAGTSAILMGIATAPGDYPFTLSVTCGGQPMDVVTAMTITALTIVGPSTLTDASLGQEYSYTLAALGNTGSVVWALDDPPLPDGLTLSPLGVLSGTPSVAGYFSVNVSVTDDTGTVHRGFGLSITPQMHITSGLLANATNNVSYSAQIDAIGGTWPYSFNFDGGNLPNGLSMSAGGLITGTPNAGPGRYAFSVTATDAVGAAHGRSLALYVVGVPLALPAIQLHGGVVDDCTVGVPCSLGVYVANGGKPPFSWSATGLPPGFSIRPGGPGISNITPGDLEIGGVGTTAQTYQVGVTVMDATGATSTAVFPLTVSPLALRIDRTDVTVGVPFSSTVRVLGGTAPYTGTIVAGQLPAGLSFDGTTGVISGTPIENNGGSHMAFRFADHDGQTVTASWGMWVGGGPADMWFNIGGDLGSVVTGSSYWNQLSACCVASLTWDVTGGALPTGLTLSPDGLLSGTATTDGTYTFLVKAADPNDANHFIERQFILRVSPLSVRSAVETPSDNVGTAYKVALTATGATDAVTWTLAPFNYLPPGLALVSSEGVWTLEGTPETSGQYGFTLVATDTAGHTATLGFNMSFYPAGVTPPVAMSFGPSLGTWSVGDLWYGLYATGGNGIYTWSVEDGELPPGVSLRTDVPSWFGPGAAAVLMGLATVPETYTFTLRVTSGDVSAAQVCTMTVTALRSTDPGSLPDAFVGEPYSFTLKAEGTVNPLTWTAQNPLPPGLALSSAGEVSGTPTAAGGFGIQYNLTDGVDTLGRGVGLTVYDVHLTTAVLPNATQGGAYSAQLTASGGSGSYTFTHNGLPTGLTMTPTGAISGTVTWGEGRYGFTAWVTDSLGRTHSKNLAIYVARVPPLLPGIQIHGSGFNDCTVYVACARGLYVASGGAAPFSWSATGLPPGMALVYSTAAMGNGATQGDAEIVGVPSAAGTYSIEVTVTSADGTSATQIFPLTVSPMGLWLDATGGTVGEALSAGLVILGGTGPFSGTISSGRLPAGLSYDGAGRITGTPIESGGFQVAFHITDSAAQTLDTSVNIQIDSGTSAISVNNYWDLGAVTTAGYYENQLSVCCASGTYEWSTLTPLPAGMSLSTSGVLSGSPTDSGTHTFRVQAVDTGNAANVAVREFTLIVTPMSISMDPTLPNGFVGSAYSAPLTATGGTGAISWTLAPFSYLPPGLTLAPNGFLTGTPIASGQYRFMLTANDTENHSTTTWVSVSVYPAGVTPPVAMTNAPEFGTWSAGNIQIALYAAGGNGTYTWSVVSGDLPPGLSLRTDIPPWFQPATAGLIGIATVPGTYTFTLRVTSGSQVSDRACTLTVTALRNGDPFGLPDGRVGQPYSYALRAEGVSGTPAWTVNSPLPAWASLSSTGVLTGTPGAPGGYNIPFTLRDSSGAINSGAGLNVYDVYITSGVLANAIPNVPYDAQIVATGGSSSDGSSYTFTLQGGLPGGLTMNAAGRITGTTNSGAGRYPFDVTVTDTNGSSHRRTLTIFVVTTPPMLPMIQGHGWGLDDCTIYVPCWRGFYLTNGGTAPFTWSATGLPGGMVIRNTTNSGTPGDADLVGTPTETGVFLVTVTVTDATGATSTGAFPLRVSPLALQIDTTSVTVGVPFSSTVRVLGGTAPYTGTIVAGQLPAGLSFDGATGVISGTPIENSGGSHMVFQFTDHDGQTVTASWGLWVAGGPADMWFNMGGDLGSVLTGSAYSYQLSACCVASLTWEETGGALPTGLTLSPDGLLSGTATTDGTYTFLVKAADSNDANHFIERQFILRVSPLSVSSAIETPSYNVGTAYKVALTAAGATGAVTWALDPFNNLPLGLALISRDGVWSVEGTPTASGQFGFSLTATDVSGHTAGLWLNMSFYPEGVTPPVRITQSPGTITRSIGDIEEPLVASGGNGTYTWSVVSGSLPPGVALRLRPDLAPWYSAETTAELAGIATVPGVYPFTLRVTSGTSSADQTCVVTVTRLRGTDPYSLPDAFVGRPYDRTLGVAGNTGDVTFALNNINAPLPPGLSMDASGRITGTPSVSGYYWFDYSITDGPVSVGRRINLGVFDVGFTIETPARLPNATQNAPYLDADNQPVSVVGTGGTPPYSYTYGGGLPGGLELNPTTGIIAGTVNAGAGNYGFWLTVTDAEHVSYSRMAAIDVVGVPKRLPSISPYGNGWDDCTYGVPCSLGVSVFSGGTAPFTWSATGLPEGLSIGPSDSRSNSGMTPGDGEIAGVPAEIGTFNVTVTVTDDDGAQATNTFPLRISRMIARDFDGTGTRGEPFETFKPLDPLGPYPPPEHYRRVRVVGGAYAGYPSYTAAIVSGQLPAGLSLDATTQAVSGTPVENGNFNTTMEVTDAADPANTLRTSQWFQIGAATSTIQINSWDLGQATIGQAFSSQLWACCVPTPIEWSPEPLGATLPAGLTLSPAGVLSGTITGAPGPVTFLVRAADSINAATYGIRLLTLTLTSLAITSNSSLPFGNVGAPYSQTLEATGGSGALAWTLAPHTYLPPGLNLSAGGLLSGTPAGTGQFPFTVRVADQAGNVAMRGFTLSVYPAGEAPPLGLNIGTSQTAQVGVFAMQLTTSSVAGGVGPYTFSLTPEVDLPAGAAQIPGMRVQNGPPFPTNVPSSALAAYMGVIAEPGVYHPSIRVTDSRGSFFDQALTITIVPFSIRSSWNLPKATAGAFYSFVMEPYGGGNYSWSANSLPSGVTMDAATGELSGIPDQAGTFYPSVIITDRATFAAVGMGFTLVVDPYSITTNGALPVAPAGAPYSVTLAAPGCGSPCTWSTAGGGWPSGLSLNSTTGVISGTPTSGADSRIITIRVTGSAGTVQKVFSLTTLNSTFPVLTVSGNVLPGDVTVGQMTSVGLFALGGTPPYTWMLDSGDLPPGIALVASAENYSSSYGPGMYYLQGRAMAVGLYTFTLRVTDHAGATATKEFTWNVSPLSFQYTNLPVGDTPLTFGQAYTQPLLVLGGTGAYPAWTNLTPMPPGLTIAAATGLVSGTPVSTGGFSTSIQVVDTGGRTFTAGVYSNVAGPTPSTLSFAAGTNLGSISMGSPASWNITPSGMGSVPPYTVTALTPLPPGFSIVAAGDGVVGGPTAPGSFSYMGIATSPGIYTFTLEARDSAAVPNVGARTFTMTVLPFAMFTNATLPDAAVNAPFAQPLTAFDVAGTATWALAAGSALPPGLSLVSGTTISGTPTLAGTYSFALVVSDGTGLITQRTFSLRVTPLAIIGSEILPAVTTGVAYSYQFTSSGSGSLTWSLAAGYTLPAGLTLSPSGLLSGLRTSGSGNTTIVVTATDGPWSTSRRFLLPTVLPNPAVLSIALSGTFLSDATVGQSVSYAVSNSVSGGLPPYVFSVAPGSTLPPGLHLLSGSSLVGFNPGTTVLGGIPSAANQYTFDLIVTDAGGAQARRAYRLNVAAFGILGSASQTLTTGTSYTLQFAAAGGTAPYTFTVSPANATQDMLPPGLMLSSSGLLSGNTTSTGNYLFVMRVEDSAGRTFARNISLFVNSPGGLRVTTANPSDTWIGGYVYRSLATSITTSTYTWSVTAGALPPGTRLVRGLSSTAPNTTYLTGVPTAPGTYPFTLRATDDGNSSIFAEHAFTLRVGTTQLVTPPWAIVNILDVPSAQAGSPYSFAFKAAGGTLPYTFAPSPFDPLPPGLSLSTDGVLSGTPQSPGVYTISTIVTDAAGYTNAIGVLNLIVAPAGTAPPLIQTGGIPTTASAGVPFAYGLDILLRGGTAPFTWTVAPGSSLPPGLSILPGSNGVPSFIGGTPVTPGTFAFYLTVTDAGGQSLTTFMRMSVVALGITPDVLPPAMVGTPYTQTLVPSGGIGPYVIQLGSVTDMPPGLSFSAGGVLSGTPTHAGIFTVRVLATDNALNTVTRDLLIFVDNAAGEVPTVTVVPKPIQAYYEMGSPAPGPLAVTVAASSGSVPVTLSLAGPAGASLSTTSGLAPFATALSFDVSSLGPGTYTGLLALSAPGAVNQTDWTPVTLTVAPAPPCTYAVTPSGGSVPNTGGAGSFTVATGGACGWTAASSEPWLAITGGTTGTGSAPVSYSASPNATPDPRTATITVNGAVFTVTQFGTVCSFAISPGSVSATAAGGTAMVSVTASSSLCGWTAASPDLTLSPASGTGSGAVTVTVPPNPNTGSRQLAATIAGQTFSVSQAGIDCTVTLSPYSASAPAGASAGSVEVMTPAGCTYSTVPGPSWITVTSGASGTGPGTLVYQVEPNSTTYARAGTLTIGGQPFQITQDPLACSVTLNTTGLGSPFGPAEASGTIGVTANGPNCSWSASSDAAWASVAPLAGTGNATITVGVSSNALATVARSGTLTIAGQSVGVTQAGTTCTFALESTSGSASASGGSASVRVIAPAACGWTSASNASWLTVTSSGSQGTSAVQFSASPNLSATPRTGTLTIAGLTYTVDQAGAPCSYSVAGPATSPTLAAEGVSDLSFGFTATTTGCSPGAVSYSNWITITGTSFGGTAGSVTYAVSPNGYGTARSGTIQVGNALYTVVQSGAACAYSLNAYGKVFGVAGGNDVVLGTPTAEGCTPVYGTDQPSFITLGTLTGPVLNILSLPYEVSPFATSLTAVVRIGRITFGGQALTIKQLSW